MVGAGGRSAVRCVAIVGDSARFRHSDRLVPERVRPCQGLPADGDRLVVTSKPRVRLDAGLCLRGDTVSTPVVAAFL